jgi:transcriptional regulator with XRE-family HTH domain
MLKQVLFFAYPEKQDILNRALGRKEDQMAARSLKDGSATVGQVIREYRKARGITQKQFAVELGVEARTLRMYENGERTLENITDLRRIADLLAIDPVELGLAARTPAIADVQQIEAAVEQVASLLLQARLIEARTTIEALLRTLKRQGGQAERAFLRVLASVHGIAGHVQALTRKTGECAHILHHYQAMAKIAQALEDQTLLALALVYHGDTLRRRGDMAQALGYFEKAREECPLASVAARGTGALLLARIHLANGDQSSFEDELAHAEELAHEPGANLEVALAQFSLGTVYAEYGRGYALLGKLEQSQRYLRLAETHLPASNLWSMLLKATQAEALVHAGRIAQAMPLVIEVAHLAQMYGHQLLIERLYRLQIYLEDQVTLLRQASRALNDVLHGPIEHS